MEVPEVRCEQCGEYVVLSATISYPPIVLTERSKPLDGLINAVVSRPQVIFLAEKCRCPDPEGS